MKNVRWPLIIAAFGLAVAGRGQHNESSVPSDYPYMAAFVSTISAPPGHTELVVFPFHGKAFKIPIRSASGTFLFAPDGKALYGSCTPYPEPTEIALCKIELKTTSTTPIPGSTGLRGHGRAVSANGDRILFSDFDRLIELSLSDGKIRTRIVLPQADKHPRMGLSLSPDGNRAVATHSGRLELIDIVHVTAEPLGDELFMAAWSPNGKWLAVLEKGEQGRTILLDAKTLTRVRILGNSVLDWSPDSRYLLGLKQDRCGPYYGTLEAINVETGARTTIQSSQCQINQATTGWVSRDIAEK
jgi:WD40 repeat protein